MPIGRILLKSISESKKLSNLKTDGARLLYTWLLPHLNIEGCFSGDAEVVRGQVFTRLRKSTKEIESYLEDLEKAGLISRYKTNGDIFLIVPDFKDKQPSLNPKREGKATIPLPTPDQLQTNSRPTPPKVKLSKEKLIPLQDFFSYFCLKARKNYKLTPERQKIIEQRLKDYSLEDLKKAVDNFLMDDWPGRGKYIDIVYCIGVRNKVDNLEKWLNFEPPEQEEEIA